jgi:hypothetical protein
VSPQEVALATLWGAALVLLASGIGFCLVYRVPVPLIVVLTVPSFMMGMTSTFLLWAYELDGQHTTD